MNRKVCASLFVFILAGCASGGSGGDSSLPAPSNPDMQSRGVGPAASAAGADTDAYRIVNLGTFGGTASSAATINERGWVMGSANLAGDTTAHAFLWRDGKLMDLKTLGGPNSAIAWPNHNNFGLLAGISEKAELNPLKEPWSCSAFFPGAATTHVCVGFALRNGDLDPLETLGGPNGYAAGTNNSGLVAGWAEDKVHDPTCAPTSGQVLQFKPVYWDSRLNIHELRTYASDPDGAATDVNDLGEIVGISGTCDQAVGRFTAAHMVLWHGATVTKLPTFGGVSWNTPTAINNRGEVVGFANMPGADDKAGKLRPLAFLWTPNGGLKKIEPLPGDAYSLAEGLNNRGDVVGISYAAGFAGSRAFLYHNGKKYDLNALLSKSCSFSLIAANDIDDRGEIVGQALVKGTADAPAFLAIRTGDDDSALIAAASANSNTTAVALPQSVRERIRIPLVGALP